MADLPYPFYRLNVQGPSETGFYITLKIDVGAGGPLEGQTPESVIAALRGQLKADDDQVSTDVTKFEITSTYS